MAKIQWYPGHMHKASREMREVLSKVDMFIEVLDARIPFSSENPMLADIRAEKPCIKVLLRNDLADPRKTEQWLTWFQSTRNIDAISTNMFERQQVRGLVNRCRSRFDDSRKTITVMVAGIPNVGKSTLINILADRTIAKTGNEPAVTKRQQRISLEQNVDLLDTPGVLWPNVENPNSGLRLAATGAIRETALSHDEVAWYLAGFLLQHYPNLMQERYECVQLTGDPMQLLEHVGRKRGCIRSGGRLDMDRVSRVLINDFRQGAIGRITLETPDMREEELAAVEKERIEREEKKRARKADWKSRKKN